MPTIAEAGVGRAIPTRMFGRFRIWLFMVGLVVVLTGLLWVAGDEGNP